jgi:NDP-sugar pyrophosphorylase family protein
MQISKQYVPSSAVHLQVCKPTPMSHIIFATCNIFPNPVFQKLSSAEQQGFAIYFHKNIKEK